MVPARPRNSYAEGDARMHWNTLERHLSQVPIRVLRSHRRDRTHISRTPCSPRAPQPRKAQGRLRRNAVTSFRNPQDYDRRKRHPPQAVGGRKRVFENEVDDACARERKAHEHLVRHRRVPYAHESPRSGAHPSRPAVRGRSGGSDDDIRLGMLIAGKCPAPDAAITVEQNEPL